MRVNERSSRKMNFTLALLMMALLQCNFCHPTPDNHRIPVTASSPEEINNLYHDPANVNEQRDVAPLTDFNLRVNLEDTVREVEGLIESNPKLPRLTRGEIIDILENITSTDEKTTAHGSNRTRGDGQRAIMVVMPFTAGSAQGDIKDLYTRPPVTHMIGEDSPKVESKPKRKPTRRKPPSFPVIKIEEDQSNMIHDTNMSTKIPTAATTEKLHTTTPTTTTTTKAPTTTTTTRPVTFKFADIIITPKSPYQEKLKPTGNLQKYPQKYSNHRYPDDDFATIAPENGLRIITPPVLPYFNDAYSMPYTVKLEDLQKNPNLGNEPVQTTQKTIIDDIAIPQHLKLAVKDLDLLTKPDFDETPQELPKLPEKATFLPVTTTIKPIPDISEVADNLSPDMRDLLMNFGLLENPDKKPEVQHEEEAAGVYVQDAEVKPESYLSFKPLPDDAPTRHDMDDFLAKFGLGRKSARSQKAIAVDKPRKELGKSHQLNLEVVPVPFKGVMQDLGFTTKNVKSMKSDNLITEAPKHVFNPTVQNSTTEELGKLSKLLRMIKDLDKTNANLTEESLKNIDVETLQELIAGFNGDKFVPLNEREGPNPLNYDYKVVKSDVKRQENITITSTTTTTTTTTEAARNPLFEDLEASFGALPESQDTTTETVTTTRRSGFYYLLDWNTFLEVDDQNGKRVNLRFQPKVGDPKNFRYVTVP